MDEKKELNFKDGLLLSAVLDELEIDVAKYIKLSMMAVSDTENDDEVKLSNEMAEGIAEAIAQGIKNAHKAKKSIVEFLVSFMKLENEKELEQKNLKEVIQAVKEVDYTDFLS